MSALGQIQTSTDGRILSAQGPNRNLKRLLENPNWPTQINMS